MKNQEEPRRLDFVMTEEPPVLLIAFFGRITVSTLQDVARHADRALSGARIRFVALSFQAAREMDRESISLLLRFQLAIREMGQTIRVCDLSEILQNTLAAHGACEPEEHVETLLDAMRDFERLRSVCVP